MVGRFRQGRQGRGSQGHHPGREVLGRRAWPAVLDPHLMLALGVANGRVDCIAAGLSDAFSDLFA